MPKFTRNSGEFGIKMSDFEEKTSEIYKEITGEALTLPQVKSLLVADISDLPLNNKKKIFVAVYCHNGFDKHKAYLAAGYAGKRKAVLEAAANRMLAEDAVQEAIRRITAELVKPYLPLMEYNTFKVQYIRAFYKVTDFFNNDGTIRPLNEIEEDKLFALDGINTRYYGKDCNKEVIEYKLADRSDALREIQSLITKYKGNGVENSTPEDLQKLRDMIFSRNYDQLPGKVIGIEKGR